MHETPAPGYKNGLAASHLEAIQAAAPSPASRLARRAHRLRTQRQGARGRDAELKGGPGSCDPL